MRLPFLDEPKTSETSIRVASIFDKFCYSCAIVGIAKKGIVELSLDKNGRILFEPASSPHEVQRNPVLFILQRYASFNGLSALSFVHLKSFVFYKKILISMR